VAECSVGFVFGVSNILLEKITSKENLQENFGYIANLNNKKLEHTEKSNVQRKKTR